MEAKEWDLQRIPPKGDEDVGMFVYECFNRSKDERTRLRLAEQWLDNHRLYMGQHWGSRKKRNSMSINLFFANVNRTVANLVSKDPVAEVVDMDGENSEDARTLSSRLRKWWLDSKQREKLRSSTLKMELNGITWEKATWDGGRKRPEMVVKDPHSCFPAPGYYTDVAKDMPYFIDAVPMSIEKIEKQYNVTGIESDDVYSILGEEREEAGLKVSSADQRRDVYGGDYVHRLEDGMEVKEARALVLELWIRDYSLNGEDQPLYPGGIRVITVTKGQPKEGIDHYIVLDDRKNPMINWEQDVESYERCYLFKNIPFFKTCSYEDPVSIWGFSAAQQVGELNEKIDEIMTKLINSVMRKLTGGILIIPPNLGITKDMINNKPALVLALTGSEEKNGKIRFAAPPDLSSGDFQALDLLLSLHDRVYQIEDADRGVVPASVTAASAIVALQERNAVLIQHKIYSVDYLVENRGRCAISLWQSFGTEVEVVKVDDKPKDFIGSNYAGKEYNYVVESGSTIPKTSLQVAEQSVKFYELGLIDRQAVLEHTNFPGWKDIVERMAEDQLGQVGQLLIQAGMPEEQWLQLQAYLEQSQGGPGDKANPSGTPLQPGRA